MGYLVAEQTTATAVTAALTTLIDWVDVSSFEDLRIIIENTGGGAADAITDVQFDTSTDGVTATATDQDPGIPTVPITAAESGHMALTAGAWGTTYIRVRAVCAAADTTTAKAWLLANTYSPDVDSYALTDLTDVKAHMGITGTANDALLNRLINVASDQLEQYFNRRFKTRSYTMEMQDGDGTSDVMVDNWPIISVERVATSTDSAVQIQCTATDAYAATVSITRSAGSLPANTHLRLIIYGGTSAGTTNIAFGTASTLTELVTWINATTGWSASLLASHGAWASTELLPISGLEALTSAVNLSVPYTRLDSFRINHEEGSIHATSEFAPGWNSVFIDYTGGYATIPDDLEQLCINVVADIYRSRSINDRLKSETIGDYSYTLGDVQEAISRYAAHGYNHYRRYSYA